jgi:DNA-binding NarL/FixJ family response regulator
MDHEPQGATVDVRSAHRLRVLVAVSDMHLRSLLCWVLREDQRFQVTAAVGNASELAASQAPFDVALVELNLSGSVGLAPIADLRQRVPTPVVVVIADTGPVYLRHAAAAEGASGFLVRSEELENLADRLYELTCAVGSSR